MSKRMNREQRIEINMFIAQFSRKHHRNQEKAQVKQAKTTNPRTIIPITGCWSPFQHMPQCAYIGSTTHDRFLMASWVGDGEESPYRDGATLLGDDLYAHITPGVAKPKQVHESFACESAKVDMPSCDTAALYRQEIFVDVPVEENPCVNMTDSQLWEYKLQEYIQHTIEECLEQQRLYTRLLNRDVPETDNDYEGFDMKTLYNDIESNKQKLGRLNKRLKRGYQPPQPLRASFGELAVHNA